MGNHQSESELVALSEYQQFPLHQLPFFFHLNHIHSSFVEVSGHGRLREGQGEEGEGRGEERRRREGIIVSSRSPEPRK